MIEYDNNIFLSEECSLRADGIFQNVDVLRSQSESHTWLVNFDTWFSLLPNHSVLISLSTRGARKIVFTVLSQRQSETLNLLTQLLVNYEDAAATIVADACQNM